MEPSGAPIRPAVGRPDAAAPAPAADPRWQVWYEAHAEAVYGYVRFHLPSPDAAEDLTADTFLRAFRAADRFDARRGSVRTWLLAIARNALRDHLRRARVRRYVPLAGFRDLAVEAPSPEERVLWEDQVARLLDAVAQLSPGDRELLGLRYGSDLGADAIGELLGLTPQAVRTRLWRALKRLRAELDE